MTILFFKVEDVLNYPETEAVAPDGSRGIASDKVKELRNELNDLGPGAQLVLYGDWAKDWDFNDDKCTENGKYLIKKLDRRGLHIMGKADNDENPIQEYLATHHVDKYKVLA